MKLLSVEERKAHLRAIRKMMEHLAWEQARKAKLPGKLLACQILDGRVMAAVNWVGPVGGSHRTSALVWVDAGPAPDIPANNPHVLALKKDAEKRDGGSIRK